MLDPSRRHHPFLFEHHPERNVWSFFKTLMAGWRPHKFWTALHPMQLSRPKRVFWYWLWTSSPWWLGLIIVLGIQVTLTVRDNLSERVNQRMITNQLTMQQQQTQRSIQNMYGSLNDYYDHVLPDNPFKVFSDMLHDEDIVFGFILPMLLPILWPWITLASLMVFRISMHRVRISTNHVMRSTVYSIDVAFWVGSLLVACPNPLINSTMQTPLGAAVWGIVCLGALALVEIVASYRLAVAYRHYLRFDHPAAVVFASQVIVFLVCLNLFCLSLWW